MKPIVFCSLFLLLFNFSSGQKLVSGLVKDSTGKKLIGVSIQQKNTNKQTYTDLDGAYHLVVDSLKTQSLLVNYPGFSPQTIELSQSKFQHLEITLIENDSIQSDLSFLVKPPRNLVNNGGKFSTQLEFIYHDFSAFQDVLGIENVSILNKPNSILSFEIALTSKRGHIGFFAGGLSTSNSGSDSIDINLNYGLVGLNFGYRLINNYKIDLMSNFGIKQYHYRLFNSSSEDEIPIEEYLQNKEIDLSINQSLAYAGFTMAYKFRSKRKITNHYFSIGAYGVYQFKVFKNAKTFSKQKEVIADKSIELNNLNFGVFAAINFD